ncbi:SFT2-domain-containing protein [Dacryopinax primogenitus]|uniref:Protein transport protein SFT2 n=1 Tax=Dacryopinax primogenitus (strain DJM 731) TaxID=1858805 RepID=M5FXX2_DACPD|nr:SFT2-domain-containing protein [Dacryopinax primogenitus]EJU00630.1 SFT2-domain-containing protein [Dacryopinax primogenitus]
MSTEQTFRASLSQFRWSRGPNDDSGAATGSGAGGTSSGWSNPLTKISTTLGLPSYIPLRSGQTSNEEEAYFALSRWERLVGFAGCLLGAVICFFVAFFTLPMLAIRPQKFALSFSLGSALVMSGFMILMGPINQIKHLFSKERIPFTLAYFSSLGLTIFFSVGYRSYVGSLVSAIVQIIALLSYVMAYFPGGITTLRFGGQMLMRGAGSVLPF